MDPSITNTGLVVLDSQMNEDFISESSAVIKSSVVRSTGALRLKMLKEHLELSLQSYTALSVAYEGYSFHSTNKSFSLGELGGVYKLALYELTGEDPRIVSPNKLKIFATGSGGAGKEAMIRMAKEEGFRYSSHDLCDAFFLAKYCFYRENPEKAAELDTHRKLVRNRLEITQKEE